MGNGSSAPAGGQATPAPGTIPEKVHEMYYKVFPGADCPVTGAAGTRKDSNKKPQEASGDSCGGSAEESGKAKGKDYKHPHVYNVYGQRIDDEAEQERRARSLLPPICVYLPGAQEKINPLNRMPATPNQAPAPGQKEALSVERQKSSIPKGGTEETWLYPSPQMFYNALVRKGKADGVEERDMEAVIATHNFVNEATWARMQRWEQLYGRMYPESVGHEPRLLQFRGRPHDLSPKARLKGLLGYGVPFDRHDWIVDRGGRSLRYVIDFYYNEDKSGTEDAFVLDVRPADGELVSGRAARINSGCQCQRTVLVREMSQRWVVMSRRTWISRLVMKGESIQGGCFSWRVLTRFYCASEELEAEKGRNGTLIVKRGLRIRKGFGMRRVGDEVHFSLEILCKLRIS